MAFMQSLKDLDGVANENTERLAFGSKHPLEFQQTFGDKFPLSTRGVRLRPKFRFDDVKGKDQSLLARHLQRFMIRDPQIPFKPDDMELTGHLIAPFSRTVYIHLLSFKKPFVA
jgi:hypothetical protein